MLDFIWNQRTNRRYLLTCAAVSVLLFFLFKLCYPYPNMVMDSYVYIRPLTEGLKANSFPIGYSWFLAIFSLFSRSTTLLVTLQYGLFVTAGLLFFFTILLFFHPGRWIRRLLFVFLFVNPLFFFCSNFIMSDMLFTTLSLLWITQLIWIIARPKPYMILTHALLLVLVFTVRYNALYYPIVASLILLFTRLRPWQKATAIVLQLVLIGAFIQYTRSEMKTLTGVRQFSAFGGWKMANNALYMYGHVCLEKHDRVPLQFTRLDAMVRQYFYIVRETDDLVTSYSSGGFYGADEYSPLVQYMYKLYGGDTIFQNFKKWGPVAPFYGEYGSYLVKKYPLDFCRWFIWPNTIRYAVTPSEVFSSLTPFYLRNDALGQAASRWFHLKTLTVSPFYIELRTRLLAPYPILLALIHLCFIMGLLGFAVFNGFKRVDRTSAWIIGGVAAFWLFDLFFKLTAGAVVLRHQLFLMILEFTFALLFMEFIYRNNETEPHYSRQKVLYGDAQKREALV